MSDPVKPGDGDQGSGDPQGQPQGQPQGSHQPARTFTQADLDRIVQERLARAVPSDYEELKQKAGELDKLKEGEKTELQKAQEAAAQALERDKIAREELNTVKRTSAIQLEAMRQSADAETVAALLAGNSSITVDKDGNVVGVKEAVEALLKDKPFLKIGGTTSGGEFGGNDGKTVLEQITELERKGDRASLAEARRLKIAQGLASTR
jgi:hypothetical protein